MSLIYLVQSGDSLDGADGYSYGLVQGGHHLLLVSFVEFMGTRQKIHERSPAQLDRRELSRRGAEHIKEMK